MKKCELIDFFAYLIILLLTLTKSLISNFTGGGVHQYNSLQSVNELSAVGDDSEEDDNFVDDMSKLSMEDGSVLEFGGSVMSQHSDFNSRQGDSKSYSNTSTRTPKKAS